MTTRRFSATARTCVLIGSVVGILACIGAARAAEAVVVTGSLGTRLDGAEWWRLRPSQGPTVTVPETKGESLPDARKSVRMVYPAPYPAR